MARLFARRLLIAVALVAVAASTALLLARVAAGDVIAARDVVPTPAEIEETRRRLDLDRSPLAQWWLWVRRAARFDFGTSVLYNRPVGPLVARAAANTALVGTAALAVAAAAGIGLGILSGSARGGALAACVRAASLCCLSLPPLLTSLLFVFAAARTGWLPPGGMSSAMVDPRWSAWIADVLWHLPLPALALALPMAAALERLQAQALSEAARQPFVLAAVARGVPRRGVIVRHAWPVSLRAICAIAGVMIGTLLSGSFIVEFVTAWPGLGRLMFEALRARDVYLVAACAAAGATMLVIGTTIGDLLLAVADPRVREDAV